jgi:cyclophilin family peptidyl-prolyl cis-trans isomerase
MQHFLRTTVLILLLIAGAALHASEAKPRVQINTNMGQIVVELEPYRAPSTVQNFLGYVKRGFYKNTIFHRVMPGFVIQGGGFDVNGYRKLTRAPIRNEAANGLLNKYGTIAMARTNEPDSATSQFFINVADNPNFDSSYKSAGYAVFGHVIEGMDVALKISEVTTEAVRGIGEDVPVEKVVIESVKLLKKTLPKATKTQ